MTLQALFTKKTGKTEAAEEQVPVQPEPEKANSAAHEESKVESAIKVDDSEMADAKMEPVKPAKDAKPKKTPKEPKPEVPPAPEVRFAFTHIFT